MLLFERPILRSGRADHVLDRPAVAARQGSRCRPATSSVRRATRQGPIQLGNRALSIGVLQCRRDSNFCQDSPPLTLYDVTNDSHHQEVITSTATSVKTATAKGVDSSVLSRVAREGYGPGAWHGPDLRAALGDVTSEQAFLRPAPGRHNIAEVALHHAYYVRSVRGQLAGVAPEPFVLEGEDWFEVSDESRLTWSQILGVVESQQRRLTETIAELGAGRARLPADVDPFDLVLGITCHAVYHAGQIQLVKKLSQAG